MSSSPPSSSSSADAKVGERRHAVLPPPQLLSCTIVVGGVDLPCQFEHRDYIQTLVKVAQLHYVKEHGGDASRLVGLRNRRTNRDLYYFSAAGDEIDAGDVLEGRPYTAAPPTVSETAMSMASTRNRKFKSQMGRPGVFAITLVTAQGFHDPALVASVRLQPYTATVFESPPSQNGSWTNNAPPMSFKHSDPAIDHVSFDITVYADDDRTTALGRARVPVSRCILTPGIAVEEVVAMDESTSTVSSPSTPPARPLALRRTLAIRYVFHPIALPGGVAPPPPENSSPQTTAAKIYNSAALAVARRTSLRKSIAPAVVVDDLPPPPPSAPLRGFLTLFVKGLHVCGPQCSKLDGHSTLYAPDFEPILLVGFEETTKELFVHATECHALVFKKKYDVHSVHSEIQLDLLKPMAIAASPNATRLKSGKQAVRYGSVSISMVELLQREGAAWTLAPMPPTLGPGKQPPEFGFDWCVLRQADEEVGLVQIQATYQENYATFLSRDLHPDTAHIRPDEVDFNADLIKRNIERIDTIINALKINKAIVYDLLEWKSPPVTLGAWAGMSLGVWYFPISHTPAVVISVVLVVLAANFHHFVRGGVQRQWTFHDPDEIKMKMFRSIATLRVAPIAATDLLERNYADPKCKDGVRPMDSFVRIFYEPRFKELPERMIAQTNVVAGSRNPQYSKSSVASSSSLSSSAVAKTGADALNLTNKWFKDMCLHLNPLAKDAVLHDVVESWKRRDGDGVDTQAFKYPLLQAVQSIPMSDLEEVVEWDQSPGVLRFDVVQDNPLTSSQNLLGRVRLPLASLVTSARLGGAQIELESVFPLESSPVNSESTRKVPTLTVRAQLTLRDPSKRVTWKERLASETLYSVLEMESAKSLSLVEKYHMARNVARTIQYELGKVCDMVEKVKNFFLWTHPQKTAIAFGALSFALVVTLVVPAKIFILYSITKKFTNRFHRRCDFRLVDVDIIRLLNFMSTYPTDIDEQKIFRHANQAFLREKEHTTAQAKLQADWTGYIYKRGEGVFMGWAYRYAAVRNGKLEYWNTIADANHGVPPKGHILLSSTIDKCTKAELSNAPKDTFPFVVFNVDHRHLLDSPEGRRRIVAVTTEQDYQGIVHAIQMSG
ncbi:Aste57867_19456 [Aphanomyces stellatus]|uniref:Aste57867_19456 protein n=1 Tax=Aphanomyces stellatus TaxID=120398 RepID=A0A485LCS8_9STRA|nr:hypothetical protein As57867_019392 [Aphanomyces stellatus]VFT96168.1 Aste57867_19456 [Aphanomyces stellatus]